MTRLLTYIWEQKSIAVTAVLTTFAWTSEWLDAFDRILSIGIKFGTLIAIVVLIIYRLLKINKLNKDEKV